MPAKKPVVDYRARLEAIRDTLTAEMDHAEGAALAAVAKQLGEVLAKIENLPAKEANAVDDLAKRRRARRPAVGDSARGSVKRGTGSD